MSENNTNFQCNICGSENSIPTGSIHREGGNCTDCGSNVRFRALIYAMANKLFDKEIILKELAESKDITGMGMSDAEQYANFLADKFSYTNYFYHTEPYMDITDIDDTLHDKFDFIISSDVLEHINPPREVAFTNSFDMLKDGGLLVFTVPYTLLDKTVEYYPDLHDYHFINLKGRNILVNEAIGGPPQLFDNLFWHGGEGSTLEIRVFCLDDLIDILECTGFTDIDIHSDDVERYGIIQKHQEHSFVITAKKLISDKPKKDIKNLVFPQDEIISHDMVHYPNKVNDISIIDIIKHLEVNNTPNNTDELQQELDRTYGSLSWKITSPLRKLRLLIK